MKYHEYESALKRKVKKVVAGVAFAGLLGTLAHGQEYLRLDSMVKSFSLPGRSFLSEMKAKDVYSSFRMEESQVSLAVWRAESAAKGRVYGAIGYTEAKRFEGREDPHLVRKYMEKGVTIQEVVSAVRSLVTSAREGRTVETRLDEIVRQWHEKRYPWDTMPWENRLPFSKQHPMAGFVLVVLQEEKKKRRSEERGRLTRRERELVGRKRELEREREEVTAEWEEAILEEGRRLEAYEEAKGRRERIERELEEGGLSSEERERLEKELAVAKEEEKRAREAYEEAKKKREEIERRKKEIEEEIGRVEEALKLVEERLGELAPEDVREALEMEQEGEDIEGRGGKKEDTPSKSSSSSEKSSSSGSSSSSSSSSEKKGILSSIAEGVSKAVNTVGNAIAGAVNSVVDTASKIAAYVGQEAKKVVEGVTGGKKEGDTAKPKPPKRHVNSDVYNRAWEIARKEWAKEGGKKPISDYGQKAVNQADYERKMEKARRLYEEAKASDPNFSHGLDYFKDEVRWEIAIEDRLDRAMAGIERGDEEAMKRFQEAVERTMKEMEGFDELQRRVGLIAGEVLNREEGRREARPRMIEEREASKQKEVSSEAKVYTVEKGDTLVKISQKTGIPLKKLLEMNPHLRGRENYIEVGEGINLDPETIPEWANRQATAEEKAVSRQIGLKWEMAQRQKVSGGGEWENQAVTIPLTGWGVRSANWINGTPGMQRMRASERFLQKQVMPMAFDIGVGFIPVAGEVNDVVDTALAATTGKDKWGRVVSKWMIPVMVAACLLPVVSTGLMKVAGKATVKATTEVVETVGSDTISRMAKKYTHGRGKELILGAYRAEEIGDELNYIEYAQKYGGKYFQMPEEVYNRIGRNLAWEVNKKVLDNAMEKGWKIKYVSSDYEEILDAYRGGGNPKRVRYRELYYLWEKGYPKLEIMVQRK
ncbi:hypothetical protein BREVNS_1305 [Brevinematales bacterium NS]|nr:hypothetical protein BREVNS_1305 [Brevinematales bacterium NS]